MTNSNRERTRRDALRNERLYRTDEMLSWLSERAGIPGELGEAFLGSWVGLLRHRILHLARTDDRYFSNVREGRIGLGLSAHLGPADCDPAQVVAQFGEELELPHESVFGLIESFSTKLVELDVEHKAFEPVGWVEPAWRARAEEWAGLLPRRGDNEVSISFLVHFWSDFLSPTVEISRPLVEEAREGDPEGNYHRWAK
jgi:hypothetical protein